MDCIYDTRSPHLHLCMSDFHSNFELRQNSIEKKSNQNKEARDKKKGIGIEREIVRFTVFVK